mmetsp:Transcript_23485/g.55597  ORF Transcript_23485/g.55597 Transcript_23485/m.55597 type:complete len:207 (+) Transcript_23485:82-702(+)
MAHSSAALKTAVAAMIVLGVALTSARPTHAAKCPSPSTVDTVEIPHYLGRWYEIADNIKFRNQLEQGLVCTTANYSMNADGTIKVDNSGRKGSPTGDLSQAIGKARESKLPGNGKLEVSFFGPFYGPYWITQLYGDAAQGYEVSVVYSCSEILGFKTTEDLWILSRTPKLPADVTMDSLLQKASGMGIDVAALNITTTYQGSDCVY